MLALLRIGYEPDRTSALESELPKRVGFLDSNFCSQINNYGTKRTFE